jgi:hypothetical protein
VVPDRILVDGEGAAAVALDLLGEGGHRAGRGPVTRHVSICSAGHRPATSGAVPMPLRDLAGGFADASRVVLVQIAELR